LNLPHLSMLFSREMVVDYAVHDLYWARIDESGERNLRRFLDISVLDRLPNYGANLKQLGICLDPDDQRVSNSRNRPILEVAENYRNGSLITCGICGT
jgi:hypothetical protein